MKRKKDKLYYVMMAVRAFKAGHLNEDDVREHINRRATDSFYKGFWVGVLVVNLIRLISDLCQ